MTYKITVITDGKSYPLYQPGADDLQLIDPVITLELNSSGSLSFEVPPEHPFRDKIQALSSEFFVYQNGDEIFRGRNTGSEEDYYKTGSITCEGDLAYLLDSIQRPYDHAGNIEEFFQYVLNAHNGQVEERKQFHCGTVNVTDNTSDAQRINDTCSTTLECLKGQLVESHGGYLRTRLGDNGKRYLDYMTDFGGYNSQPIRFRENLLDIGRKKDATTIRTALIPYGAQQEMTNEDGTSSTKRVDITSVNGGKDYIYDQEAVSRYGWIYASVTWDDIMEPSVLLETAKAYLEDTVKLPETLELTAVDLSLIQTDVAALKLGYWTRVVSEPHGLKGEYLLTKKVLHLTEPERDTIVLGGTVTSITGSTSKDMAAISLKVQEISRKTTTELVERINNATRLITGGLGGYVMIGMADDGHPDEIVIMDTPSVDTARNVIRLNKNGFGFSSTGYNGIFENAWTIDGHLNAGFITAGTMLADRIRGGILELGGKGLGKDGVIIIKNTDGEELARFDKNGITINKGNINMTSGSITLPGFTLTSGGVLTLDGTSNNTTVGANLINCNTLRVSEQIMASGATFNIGGMFSSGSYVHGSFMGDFWGNFYQTSDKRLKKRIRPLDTEQAIAVVKELKPVSYEMKQNGSPMIGFVAQDVIRMQRDLGISLPIISRDKEGYYCIPYSNYVALLAGAIQAQQKQIEQLKKEVINNG